MRNDGKCYFFLTFEFKFGFRTAKINNTEYILKHYIRGHHSENM